MRKRGKKSALALQGSFIVIQRGSKNKFEPKIRTSGDFWERE
jgi:hypothetical protein